MKITCTFDDTTHKVVPLDATESSIQAGCLSQQVWDLETYNEWRNSHSSGVVNKIRALCAKDYEAMIAAAPPYPADTGWIPCSERLPDRNKPCLYWHKAITTDHGGFIAIADEWRDEDHLEWATHWMPYSAPKGE